MKLPAPGFESAQSSPVVTCLAFSPGCADRGAGLFPALSSSGGSPPTTSALPVYFVMAARELNDEWKRAAMQRITALDLDQKGEQAARSSATR